MFAAYDDEVESLRALAAEANVDLLHVTLPDFDDQWLPDLSQWFGVLAPGRDGRRHVDDCGQVRQLRQGEATRV